MMLSKILILITIFVAISLRTTEGFEIVQCTTDDEFLNAAKKYKSKNVSLLVSWSPHDPMIVNTLAKSGFDAVIIVYADNNKCPITNEYLRTGGVHPAVYIMIKDRVHTNVWYSETDLRDFCRDAVNNRSFRLPVDSTVTEIIEKKIIERKQRSVLLGRPLALERREEAPPPPARSVKAPKSMTEKFATAAALTAAVAGTAGAATGLLMVGMAALGPMNPERRRPVVNQLSGSGSRDQRTTQTENSGDYERIWERDEQSGRLSSRQSGERASTRRKTN